MSEGSRATHGCSAVPSSPLSDNVNWPAPPAPDADGLPILAGQVPAGGTAQTWPRLWCDALATQRVWGVQAVLTACPGADAWQFDSWGSHSSSLQESTMVR